MVKKTPTAVHPRLPVAICFLFLATLTLATDKVFQWKFSGDSFSTSLATCVSLPVEVQPFNATNTTGSRGTPPYYMQAFAIDGIPITTLIGADNQTLNWQPTHPTGTKLLLTVVDSTGSAGGVPPNLYTVIAGQSTQCVVNNDPDDFTITANVTDELSTCDPWGLRIKGGVPPYNVTLAAVNSPVVTNVTMGIGDDIFVYINRADPGTQLMASISDSTGQWGKGTPLVKTKGSTDISCIGLNSVSLNSSTLNNQEERSNAAALILGACVTLGVLLLLGGLLGYLYRQRRQSRYRRLQDILPRRFEDPPKSYHAGELQPPIELEEDRHRGSSSVSRERPNSGIASDEMIIQHRHGGAVRELPPPYADHTSESTSRLL